MTYNLRPHCRSVCHHCVCVPIDHYNENEPLGLWCFIRTWYARTIPDALRKVRLGYYVICVCALTCVVRMRRVVRRDHAKCRFVKVNNGFELLQIRTILATFCLLYTSDAADE